MGKISIFKLASEMELVKLSLTWPHTTSIWFKVEVVSSIVTIKTYSSLHHAPLLYPCKSGSDKHTSSYILHTRKCHADACTQTPP